jgi:hypothetical protein
MKLDNCRHSQHTESEAYITLKISMKQTMLTLSIKCEISSVDRRENRMTTCLLLALNSKVCKLLLVKVRVRVRVMVRIIARVWVRVRLTVRVRVRIRVRVTF